MKVSANHAMISAEVPTSGAGMSTSGPIWSMIALQYRLVSLWSSPWERLRVSTLTPPLPPPNGIRTTAHFMVMRSASDLTSSR